MIEELYFRPGAVFHYKDYPFSEDEKRNKIFIILSYKNANNGILTIITTSQIYDISYLEKYKIPAGKECMTGGKKTYFIKDTYIRIGNDRIIEFKLEKIIDKYREGRLTYFGILKIEYLYEIINKINDSWEIEQIKKREIIKDYNRYCKEMGFKGYNLG